ncbi:MAG: helix-turn-helix domain-containing protein [Chloroflexi bacterium]|nr:helix-turn-helix domain-containing protein [Chloroflexota bacterium]
MATESRTAGQARRPSTIEHLVRVPRRYRRVLELIAVGESNKEIAAQLGLAPNTIRRYVSELLALYGVDNRVRLALAATPVPAGPDAETLAG